MRHSILLCIAGLLLAGCIESQPMDGSEPAPGTSPDPDLVEDVEGPIGLVGSIRECDAGWCFNATATNEGSTAVHVSSICVPPFSESMTRDGEAIAHKEPMFYCAAFGTEPMAPGESRSVEFTWDQTVWDDEAGQTKPAPEGNYAWSVHFEAYEQSDGGGRHKATITDTITVGEP